MFQKQSYAEESPKRAIHLQADKYTPKKIVYLNQNMHIGKNDVNYLKTIIIYRQES